MVRTLSISIHEFTAEIVTAHRDGTRKDPNVSVEVAKCRLFDVMGKTSKPGDIVRIAERPFSIGRIFQ